ncbi:MAG: phosphoethanolamine--lipid A transferase [Psychromonas sp.]|nr:phosphoethanolamine--lipid A transferase [Psychromonas sp.]
MTKSIRPAVGIPLYIIILSLYYTFVLNYPLASRFYDLSINSGTLFTLSSPFVLIFAFIIIFTLLSIPYIFKPFIIFLTLASSLALYAALKYNVMFDSTMVENIFETNPGEATSYINSSLVLYFTVTGIIPACLIFYVKIKPTKTILRALLQRGFIIVIAVLGMLLLATFYYKSYASIARNNSYLKKMINPAYLFNSVKYLHKKYFTKKLDYLVIGKDSKLIAAKNNKPILMILILGETARAQNSTYNGYSRNTTPYTKKLGLIAFQNVASCGTETAVSVPCMFSNMPRDSYYKARANTQDNVLDLLTYAGVDVIWKDNDGGSKGVDKHVKSVPLAIKDNPELCKKGGCYDEILLKGLDDYIKSNNKNKLIALHIKGSHGPTYWLRYPPKMEKFTPSCDRSDIEKCSDKELVNVYDNTLVYTDYILAKSIELLKKYQHQYNVALIYLSDHGESLGENGFYLHGSPYVIAPIYQRRVPWLLWMPDQYAQAKGIKKTCLIAKAKATKTGLSHDNFFHTLLGFYGVKTKAKDDNLDLIESCKIK